MSLKRGLDMVVFVARESLRSFPANRGLERAAVLAYNSFFALFPLLLLVLYLTGYFMASSQAAMGAVDRMTAQLFPMFSDVVIREVQGLATHTAWGLASVPLLFWGVMPLAAALRGAFDNIHKTDRGLPYLKEKLIDALAVFLMLVLIILLVTGEVAYALAKSHVAGALPFLVRLLDVVVPLVVTLGFLAFINVTFSPVRLGIGSIVTGCMVSAVLLAVMGPAFTAFLRFDPNYGVTFGSLKAVYLLLIWVYASFAVILFGVEVTANIHRREALLVRELLMAPEKRSRSVARLTRHVAGWEAEHVLFRVGEAGDHMYYVVSGAVRLSRHGEVLRVMNPGEYFGEMAMLLKASRTATATVAESGTRLVEISAANFETILSQNPQVVFSLLREMADRLRSTSDKFGS